MKLRYLLPVIAGFGALGAVGAYGAATPPSFTAVVDNTGALARGYHAVSASHISTGKYQVNFSRIVSGCNFTATVGSPLTSGAELAGVVNVAARAGRPKAILVQTYNLGGARSDRGFHVIAAC